ncbi:LicD family protein [Natronomonas gomsonensis]|uniref:LicD family protein n=1 Tax=Natronomonas gomsonensis TaxID=1046043 RepID=UPI0015B8AC21|nr:LicD family protein [Natronomonas gomsonensis]
MNPYPADIEEQMYWVRDLLEEQDVSYWLDLGVLLGLVREGHPIEWDDDVEFGVWADEIETVEEIVESLCGFTVRRKIYDGEVHGMDVLPESPNDGVKTTFVVYRIHDDTAWSATAVRSNNLNPFARLQTAYYWYVHQTEILDPVWNTINEIRTRQAPKQFYMERNYSEEFEIYMPAQVEEYLEYVYGDWRTPTDDYHYWDDSGLVKQETPIELMS